MMRASLLRAAVGVASVISVIPGYRNGVFRRRYRGETGAAHRRDRDRSMRGTHAGALACKLPRRTRGADHGAFTPCHLRYNLIATRETWHATNHSGAAHRGADARD